MLRCLYITGDLFSLESLRLAFKANGRSDYVTLISPHMPFTFRRFLEKVTRFVLAINSSIT